MWSTVSSEQRDAYDISGPLAQYAGFHVMHFGTDDIDGVHRRLIAEGRLWRCAPVPADGRHPGWVPDDARPVVRLPTGRTRKV
jgi:hypothetical protein